MVNLSVLLVLSRDRSTSKFGSLCLFMISEFITTMIVPGLGSTPKGRVTLHLL